MSERQTFYVRVAKDYMVTTKPMRDVRRGDTILHPDGEPAVVADHHAQAPDAYGKSYGVSFEGDRVPFAARPHEMMQVLAPIPEWGSGATMQLGSDRYPFTVIGVSKTGKKVTLQADDFVRTDKNGLSETQMYHITSNPDGETRVAVWSDRYGRWRVGTAPIFFGNRSAYQDPSF